MKIILYLIVLVGFLIFMDKQVHSVDYTIQWMILLFAVLICRQIIYDLFFGFVCPDKSSIKLSAQGRIE